MFMGPWSTLRTTEAQDPLPTGQQPFHCISTEWAGQTGMGAKTSAGLFATGRKLGRGRSWKPEVKFFAFYQRYSESSAYT